MSHLPVGSLPVLDRTCKQGKENTGMRDNQTTRRMPMIVTAMACAAASMPDQAPLPGDATGDMNYREAEAVTVSCFAERMENIRRLSTYDSDALSTGLYSPRSKGILSEYSDCPSQTMV